eukprot:m51a1_g5948 hypothetical protein (453) ;mRNA; f:130575-132225
MTTDDPSEAALLARLFAALRDQDSALVRVLARCHDGALLDCEESADGDRPPMAPLALACTLGYRPVVEALLRAGANPLKKGADGTTPLMEAAKAGHVDVVKALLREGAVAASVDDVDGSSLTALAHARKNGHEKVVDELAASNASQACALCYAIPADPLPCCKMHACSSCALAQAWAQRRCIACGRALTACAPDPSAPTTAPGWYVVCAPSSEDVGAPVAAASPSTSAPLVPDAGLSLRALPPLTQDQTMAEMSIVNQMARSVLGTLDRIEQHAAPALAKIHNSMQVAMDPAVTVTAKGRIDACREGRSTMEALLRFLCARKLGRGEWSESWPLSKLIEALEPHVGAPTATSMRSAKEIANSASHAPLSGPNADFDIRHYKEFLFMFSATVDYVLMDLLSGQKNEQARTQQQIQGQPAFSTPAVQQQPQPQQQQQQQPGTDFLSSLLAFPLS